MNTHLYIVTMKDELIRLCIQVTAHVQEELKLTGRNVKPEHAAVQAFQASLGQYTT